MDEFHVSSAVVYCQPPSIQALIEELTAYEGVEVHGFHPEGRLVVTVEGGERSGLVDVIEEINRLPKVLCANLVYHQYESNDHNEKEEG
ncbi:chaperone NapD [Aliagarivorans taiwanensis]|uniref:chaperone NapD n=1 Tax=Aliagarivorans taiwanensis TaxID=561966 RepID=UPI0003FFA6CE|nr:chaperone NapD [Aliagarivorans taiwanensis]